MEKEIIGYKVLDKDLKSPSQKFQYEIGKIYEIEDKPVANEKGFHYYTNIDAAMPFVFADINRYKLFKVRVLGDISKSYDKRIACTNRIEILSEVYMDDKYMFKAYSGINLDDALDNIHNLAIKDRVILAWLGYGLGVLINDKNHNVRAAVAEQGYGLDILINDPNWYVEIKARLQKN